MRQFLPIVLILALLLTLATRTVPTQKTEILWDTWGVPHIFAKDSPELFKAFGWAQMHSHGDLILRLYGQARGRAAEYWGEDYFESDRQVLTMGIDDRARQWYDQQTPEIRSYLDGFAAGMNAYGEKYSDRLDPSLQVVLPVTGVDILAHIQRVVYFTFLIADVSASQAMGQPGSNAIAIAPQASATGNTLLLVNPHLPWSERFLLYEAQLSAPGLDAYGCTLVGMPMLVMAFNNNLGWTHTVNQHNGWGLYQLTLTEGGYLFDGRVKPLEAQQKTLKVKQSDGTLQETTVAIARSIHGPIIAQTGNTAIALKVTGLEESGAVEQYWEMLRSRNLSEFETALQKLQIPLFTILYGDKDGHILHLFNGQVPVRPQGNWDTWREPVPGDTSQTLWTEIHSYHDLPRVLDPPGGWLQNANDPPWTTTIPPVLDPDDYPPYFSSREMNLRAQRSAKLVRENLPMTLDKLVEAKFSTRMELADRFLDDLLAAVGEEASDVVQEAAAVLKRWDRQTEADSRGAVLFAFWAQEMGFETQHDRALVAIEWDADDPLNTPDGLRDRSSAVAALERVAGQVKAAYGSLDVPWGEVFRARVGDVDLPANGGDGDWGIFSVLQFAPAEEGRFQAVFGDTYIAAIEFSDPIQGRVLLPYGNATQPRSPHIGDQLPLYVQKQLRPIWRTRKDIEAHLELKMEL
ncbi:MAG: acylase [Cyanobacteriota bacterium]|nr:acylase [Cyanobacteriota bacterium]